jgi:succinate dehydrogenase flavin-adding protein (antitoxin of CptAB toxin-antitoxin module)
MKRSSLSTWVYLLLVFSSGAALGVFSDHLYTTKTVLAKSVAAKNDPNEFRRKYIDEMRTRLKLNTDQVNNLSQILDQTDTQMHDLHQKYRPEMTSIHNAQVESVKRLLTDAQRSEYQKMLAEREARRQADKK